MTKKNKWWTNPKNDFMRCAMEEKEDWNDRLSEQLNRPEKTEEKVEAALEITDKESLSLPSYLKENKVKTDSKKQLTFVDVRLAHKKSRVR